MSVPAPAPTWHHRFLLCDPHKILFSLSSYFACVITLGIAFAAELPRPWWAILTVYVTAQPMSGALRPKVSYRLIGIVLGAIVSILLVPNLQNSPELLVLSLAAWTGFCIYLAVSDRTPRAFLFQMAGFSAAVISFPYLDDPDVIFTTTISRVEEMTVAIVAVTVVHSIMRPWNVREIIQERARSFLRDAMDWADGALDAQHKNLSSSRRQRIAADVTELGIVAIHLPYDMPGLTKTRALVYALQRQLASLIPLASAVAHRLDLLSGKEPEDKDLVALIEEARAWLQESDRQLTEENADKLIARARSLARKSSARSDWSALIAASLAERLAEFIETVRDAEALVMALDGMPPRMSMENGIEKPQPLTQDRALAVLAGAAMAAAIVIYCLIWILLAWPAGSATAAFAALVTCSFAAQEDPAPAIRRYLLATLATFPIAAIYMFVVLPCVDGYAMLSLALAPALIGIGYIQADPARSAIALPMFSCLIVGLGFVDSFQPDFASFVNTGIAQVMGIVVTIAVTRLFRSVGAEWTARRMVRRQWSELEALANARSEPDFGSWTARALDHTGQIAARIAVTGEGDEAHAADGLSDIRIGRNILHLRRAAAFAHGRIERSIDALLAEVAHLFRRRRVDGDMAPPRDSFWSALDSAIAAIQTMEDNSIRHQALLAAVGIRCNLIPLTPITKRVIAA
ncbi:MAG: FUSC family protein [Proteobacteria bacterium]|nr:FUSC family protein [Pseudomonadota bacterium]